ncbi:MAG: hypothetical protein DLM68_17210 [Hyphomicrobiales bacterium]|nr:MAG: hypothetical protein DLM68_17210 [Hyphomicrobiales bacterium]
MPEDCHAATHDFSQPRVGLFALALASAMALHLQTMAETASLLVRCGGVHSMTRTPFSDRIGDFPQVIDG